MTTNGNSDSDDSPPPLDVPSLFPGFDHRFALWFGVVTTVVVTGGMQALVIVLISIALTLVFPGPGRHISL